MNTTPQTEELGVALIELPTAEKNVQVSSTQGTRINCCYIIKYLSSYYSVVMTQKKKASQTFQLQVMS